MKLHTNFGQPNKIISDKFAISLFHIINNRMNL